ncbi:DUF2512 family protein [Syntrophomonas erecta]
MGQTSRALLVKLVMTFIAGLLTLSLIDGNRWWPVLVIAIIGTAVNYFVGDLVVLPALGNITASIGDGIMAALVAYVVALAWPEVVVSFTSLLVFAIIIMVGEYFFHQYLEKSEEVAP